MNDKKVRAIINDAPDRVTSGNARLEDILCYGNVSTGILEQFYYYWQAEAEATRQLKVAFTHLNFGYQQTDAIPPEVNRRYEIARVQTRLYDQEYELQSSLQDSKSTH